MEVIQNSRFKQKLLYLKHFSTFRKTHSGTITFKKISCETLKDTRSEQKLLHLVHLVYFKKTFTTFKNRSRLHLLNGTRNEGETDYYTWHTLCITNNFRTLFKTHPEVVIPIHISGTLILTIFQEKLLYLLHPVYF